MVERLGRIAAQQLLPLFKLTNGLLVVHRILSMCAHACQAQCRHQK